MQESVLVSGEEVSVRLLLLALLEDQGQTNNPHPCVQQKGKKKLDSQEN
jgi:hypothetical protein